MALQHAPRTFSRFIYFIQIRRGWADRCNSGAQRRNSCVPTEAPECPPCEPRPPPPCREPATSCPSGLRVVCCAPPVGQRPPCHPPQPPVSLTCNHINKQEKINTVCKFEVDGCSSDACGTQLDRVARRLEAEERIRRLEYEREVAKQRPSIPLPTPTYTYRLAEERECMRATDGHDYIVTKLDKNDRRCDAFRNPPPPCPIPLDPVDKCKITQDTKLDPCSHHPRIFVEIDRSQTLAPITKPQGQNKSTIENLTSDAIENIKQHKSKTEVHHEHNAPKKNEAGLNRDIQQKCIKIPLPKDVPIRCKEPSLIERLRRRSGGASSKTDNPRRELHTGTHIFGYCRYYHSSTNSMASQDKLDSNEGILNILQERRQLTDVARGRVTASHENIKDDTYLGAGGIELKIPPSTEAIRVRVLLDFNTATPMSCANNSVGNPTNNKNKNITNGSNTWLSIKNLQQKIKECRKGENVTVPKKATSERKTSTEPSRQSKQNPCIPQNALPKTSHSTSTCPKATHRPSNPPPCKQQSLKSKTKFIDTQNYPLVPL